jgi:hypothetical protein
VDKFAIAERNADVRYCVPLRANAVEMTSDVIAEGPGLTSVSGVRVAGGVAAPGNGRGTPPRLAQAPPQLGLPSLHTTLYFFEFSD